MSALMLQLVAAERVKAMITEAEVIRRARHHARSRGVAAQPANQASCDPAIDGTADCGLFSADLAAAAALILRRTATSARSSSGPEISSQNASAD